MYDLKHAGHVRIYLLPSTYLTQMTLCAVCAGHLGGVLAGILFTCYGLRNRVALDSLHLMLAGRPHFLARGYRSYY